MLDLAHSTGGAETPRELENRRTLLIVVLLAHCCALILAPKPFSTLRVTESLRVHHSNSARIEIAAISGKNFATPEGAILSCAARLNGFNTECLW